MRISKLVIDPAAGFGLQQGEMSGLGKLVVLAGPNGAGKSRLMRYVSWCASGYKTADQRAQLRQQNESGLQSIANWQRQIESIKNDSGASPNPQRHAQLERSYIVQTEQSISQAKHALWQGGLIALETENEQPNVVRFSVSGESFRGWKEKTTQQLESDFQTITTSVDTQSITPSGIAAIQQCIRHYLDTTHQQYNGDPALALAAKISYDELRNLVKVFLGTDLTYGRNADPQVFGKSLAEEAELSEGQKVLLKIALALHFQGGRLADLVLLMDEPENHLHPKALAEVIERVQSACPNGQVWIATHSLSVLARCEADELWFVKDGAVQRGGVRTQEVLESLLGEQEGIDRLAAFLAKPANYAATQFAWDCLRAPTVADTAAGDPQTRQIRTQLDALRSVQNSGRLRVLDYGAGAGRLLTELLEGGQESGVPFSNSWDYFAFDAYATNDDQKKCVEKLAVAYPSDASSRYFDNWPTLSGKLNAHSTHVVVLCNVLHEVSPSDWPELFSSLGGQLSADGYLMIVEDHCLKQGECAHDFGFLVLDEPEIKKLMAIEPEATDYVVSKHPRRDYAERLKAHLIPAKYLQADVKANIKPCLMLLQKNAESRANAVQSSARLQAEKPSYRQGHDYAYWTQQHFNASRAVQKV